MGRIISASRYWGQLSGGSFDPATFHLAFGACIQNGTLVIGYYAGVNRTGTSTCSALGQWTGGTAADVLVQATPAIQPIIVESEALLAGLPCLQGTGTQYMQSTTPGSAFSQAQPYTRILLCVEQANADEQLVDSASATARCALANEPNQYVYAGAVFAFGGEPPNTNGSLLFITLDGASSTARRRDRLGTVDTYGPGNAGSQSCQGVTWFARYAPFVGLDPANAKITLDAFVTSMSSADRARVEALMVSGGWT